MKRNSRAAVTILLCLVIYSVATAQPVSAHSLQWGVMPGARFEFTAYGDREDIGVVDVNYSLTITALETIPDTPVFPEDFPRTTISMKNLDGGASLDMGNDVSSLCYGSFSAMPIGDWNYLSSVVEAYSGGIREVTAFQNTTHWGYSDNAEDANDRVLKTTIYLKENGIMESFTGSHWNFVTLKMIEDVTIRRTVPSTSTTTSNPTTTTTGTTTVTTTTSDTTTNPDSSAGMSIAIAVVAAGLMVSVVGIGGIYARKKRKPGHGPLDAKVLVICPYCGKKTEQGITKCDKCGADL